MLTSYENIMDDKMIDSKNGTVEVRAGSIIVTDPSGDGKEAVISPGKGIKLFVDGIEIKERASVFQRSKIRVEITNKEPAKKFEVSVSEDRLTASVSIEYKEGVKFSIKDRFPSNMMVLEAFPSGGIDCPPYTIEEAMVILKEKGVIHGIEEDTLLKAIMEGRGNPIVAARGTEPVDGTDDSLDIKFDDNKKFVEVNDRVDFYSIGKVTSVEPNTLIAELIVGDPGKAGMDVLGKEIPQKKGKRIALEIGRGARRSEDGIKVFSNILGRPEVKGSRISVYEVYEVSSDVDLSTGNIEFVGDVIIKGSIAEGMKVKAGNSVILYGNIVGGEITAGSDVKVYKNIISSRVKGGCNDFLKLNLIEMLESISKAFMSIFSAVQVLKETGKVPKVYKDGQIIKLLIDTKFNSLNDQVTELRNTLADSKEYLGMETLRLGARLVKYFMGNGPLQIAGIGELRAYVEEIDNQISALKAELKEPSNISAYYVQNSTLTTSGDIIIEGKGCYTSELYCRGRVTIEKVGSVTRGGTISAGGEVKIYELGSPGGAPTAVSTAKDSVIYCETAHVNSVVKVGEMSSRIEASVKKIKAYLYKGELMVEKSKIL